MDWKQLLASITGSVDEELRLRNAYRAAENRILRNQIKARRLLLTDAERKTLAEMGHQLGRQALQEIATIAQPDTILAWHRKFMDHTMAVRRSVSRSDGPASTRSWKTSWYAWPARIARGGMTAL